MPHPRIPRWLRRILPAVVDALAALLCSAGVLLMVLGIKPVPRILDGFLGPTFSYIWAALLLFGSLAAAAGSVLRVAWRKHPSGGFLLEYLGWPSVAWCAAIFACAAASVTGVVDGLLTIGFAGFVAATCVGHWWRLREARIAAIKKLGKAA